MKNCNTTGKPSICYIFKENKIFYYLIVCFLTKFDFK